MKKLLSCLVSIGVLTSTLLSFGSSTSFAATQSVLLGDAIRFYKQNPYI